MIPDRFRAFRIHDDAAGYRSGIEDVSLGDLAAGEVVVKAAYSSVNFKDALAGTGQGRILRRFPLVGGIDVAGHVLASTDPAFREGDAVLATGCGLSETRDGGYSQYARLQAQWTIPLPAGLSLRESMILGTAGFTAALALYRMREEGWELAHTTDELEVNSMHHQAIKRLGRGLTAVAWAPDQVVEGAELDDPTRFVLGVQWHPEELVGHSEPARRLFAALVAAARRS